MDRYGAFIWPAYAITVLVFIGMTVVSLAGARRWRKRWEDLNR